MYTKYDFLLAMQNRDFLKLLQTEFTFPVHYNKWMTIYAYHLQHPKASQLKIANHFGISAHMVNDALQFMSQPFTAEVHFSFPD